MLAVATWLCACGDDLQSSSTDSTSTLTSASTSATSSTPTSTGNVTESSTTTVQPTTSGSDSETSDGTTTGPPPVVERCALDDGRCIFRHDTFGDAQLWTDVLGLHELVQGLPPTGALAVGLKVDAQAVPADVLAAADLEDPATTVALLGLDAIVGVSAVIEDGMIVEIGITCALCHSTVDDSVAPGIGLRLDGWPNRDLDPGKIIALTPGLPALAASLGVETEAASVALLSWGPGRYDARFNQDKQSAPVLIPPAYGLANVALETYTGEGPISYWNAYVAVTQMGAQGNFADAGLGLDIMHDPDLVTDKLPALRDYQFSLEAPAPLASTFDAEAAGRGSLLFDGIAQCSTCHSGDAMSDAPTLHDPEEVGADPTEAIRSQTGQYRTTPLRGAWQHPPYFHDGSAATFAEVVTHYDDLLELGLDAGQRADLVEYLRSL
jgi:mono/diheme cytochrome c family protein